MVTGGQFTIETYIDVGPLSAPVFPLDDRGTFVNSRVSSKRWSQWRGLTWNQEQWLP